MAAFDITPNLGACAIGPFTAAQRALAFPDSSSSTYQLPITGTPENLWSVVAEPTAANGKALRRKYPANHIGAVDYFQVRVVASPEVGNIRFKWRAVAPRDAQGNALPFDWGSNPTQADFKIPGTLKFDDPNYGNVAYWDAYYTSHRLIPALQNNATGAHYYNPPPSASSLAIVPNVVHDLRIQAFTGPNGFARHWIDGVLVKEWLGNIANASGTTTPNHYYGFAGHAGGGSQDYAPATDMFFDLFDIHIWSEPLAAPQMAITQAVISLS